MKITHPHTPRKSQPQIFKLTCDSVTQIGKSNVNSNSNTVVTTLRLVVAKESHAQQQEGRQTTKNRPEDVLLSFWGSIKNWWPANRSSATIVTCKLVNPRSVL
ncbi:hypothetical protein AAHE18_20G166300 [Arachis hypogaea]